MSKNGKNRLQPAREVDVPLREVSGICLRRGVKHEMSLMAVGDRSPTLAWTPLPACDDGRLDWRTVNIAHLPGTSLPAEDPQIEAICADGSGRVLLLQESPPRAELVDVDASRIVATIDLVVEGRDELADSWNDLDCSHGEGAVLLAGGHLLVAKEKHPAALIEFGPRGAQVNGLKCDDALDVGSRWPIADGHHQFVALKIWRPDKALERCCEDFSDLEIGPDGRLYLLSDQSEAIARLDDLAHQSDFVGMSVSWRLDDLKGKPEGLAFAADGRAVVALDKRKKRSNLVLFEPAIAAAR